jgi:D-alanyl-D-alanine carboxypeptidase (penicillin-binding protein 5/6)
MNRRLLAGSLFIAVLITGTTLSVAGATESGPSGALQRPVINAAALYLVELESGRVILKKDADRRLPPASLTKIMTALIALESTPLREVVQIDRRALLHHSSYNFRPGEEFLLRDLVTAMLVASANDACEAVAWHIGGDDKRFVAMMNERAVGLNLTNTHFANPCGFDAPGHYSTASDLAKLTEHAMKMPEFSAIVHITMKDIATVNGKRHIALYNTNELLLQPYVTGVKTGHTSGAGRCLIASTLKDGHTLLLVGLNLVDQWQQATELLRYGHALMGAGG